MVSIFPYFGVVEIASEVNLVVDDSTVERCVVLLPYPLVVECSGVVEVRCPYDGVVDCSGVFEDSTVEVRCPYEGVVEDSKVLLSVVVSWYLEGVVSLSVNLVLERCVVLLPYPSVVECSGLVENSTVEVRCPYDGVVECLGVEDWRLGVVDDSTVECFVVLLPYPLVVEWGVDEDSVVLLP